MNDGRIKYLSVQRDSSITFVRGFKGANDISRTHTNQSRVHCTSSCYLGLLFITVNELKGSFQNTGRRCVLQACLPIAGKKTERPYGDISPF